jgi:hypothetical protein
MLRLINSDLIENNYLRILLLVVTISLLTFIHFQTSTKKVGGNTGSGMKGPLLRNYIGYFIIFFVIPKFFDIDQSGILNIINMIGFMVTFIFSLFAGAHIIVLNLILITISVFI